MLYHSKRYCRTRDQHNQQLGALSASFNIEAEIPGKKKSSRFSTVTLTFFQNIVGSSTRKFHSKDLTETAYVCHIFMASIILEEVLFSYAIGLHFPFLLQDLFGLRYGKLKKEVGA